jgi:hypothetical protein
MVFGKIQCHNRATASSQSRRNKRSVGKLGQVLNQGSDLLTPSLTQLGDGAVIFDTEYMCTYTVFMNVTLSIDEQLVARARKKAEAVGKSLNQLIRDYLECLIGGDDPEGSIAEFKRLSGRGHSRGWRFNRNEIHERS